MKMTSFAKTNVVVRQEPFAKFAVWAAFAIEIDAREYAVKLRHQHPTWAVEVRLPYIDYSAVL